MTIARADGAMPEGTGGRDRTDPKPMLKIQLQKFDQNDAELWFTAAEAAMDAAGIWSQSSKYHKVIGALDFATLWLCTTVIKDDANGKYFKMKELLLSLFEKSDPDHWREFMEASRDEMDVRLGAAIARLLEVGPFGHKARLNWIYKQMSCPPSCGHT